MNISTFQANLDFIKSLYFHEEWKDEDCRDDILEAIEECNQKIEKAFGKSMHFLHEHKPSVEAVEKVAKKFSSTLSYVDEEDGQIPIQSAITSDGYEYVPTLAKEGIKQKVGGEDARGGLLVIDLYDNTEWNTLQWFVNVNIGVNEDDIKEEDAKRLNVLKELRRLGLLLKKDIREYHLLQCSCPEASKERFRYLVDWDPDALIETRVESKPLIHSDISNVLHLVLEAGFKYHPQIGGLLFIEDDDGTSAFDTICNYVEVERVMEILHDILSPAQDYPILHYAFIKAPQHKDFFTKKFPWAYHLKDHNSRTLHQALLAAGPEVMNDHEIFFASLSDNQIQTKDPITTLYPFATMAVGEHADLDKCFYLLRRQPSVLERRSRTENNRRRNKRKIYADSHGTQI